MNLQDSVTNLGDGIEQSLLALPVPAMPADLAARCRLRVAASATPSGVAGRGNGRWVLLGTAVVVAAAAAMLGIQRMSAPEPAADAENPVKEVDEVAHAVQSREAPVVSPAAPGAPKGNAAAAAALPQPFTVRMEPLKNEAQGAVARPAVEAFHASLLSGLRALPGLTLITPESTGIRDDAPVDFRLTVRGYDSPSPDQWNVDITAQAMSSGADSRAIVTMPINVLGGGTLSCADEGRSGALRPCSDPASMAAQQVDLIRGLLFPQDPALKRQSRSRLLDRTLDPAVRLRALTELRAPHIAMPEGGRLTRIQNAPLDDATIQGALDLAATAPDSALRTSVWLTLRGIGHPALVAPLADVLRHDGSDEVRLLAVKILVEDYPSDPRAESALQAAARDDSRQLVRMIAQRAIAGEAAGDAIWRDYVVATLADTSLAAAQRLEPLSYMFDSGQTNTVARANKVDALLDDAVLESLVSLAPSVWTGDRDSERLGRSLVNRLQSVDSPLVVDLLGEAVRRANNPMTRKIGVRALAERLPTDPRARGPLESVAASDPDVGLRRIAVEALQQKSVQPTPPPGT